MRNLFNNLFGKKHGSSSIQKSVVELPEVNHFNTGLLDAVRDGWFCAETSEVYTGFSISSDDVVVDVGCGDGGCALFCANRGAHVVAVDIDADKIAAITHRLASTPARQFQGMVSDSNPLLLDSGMATKIISTEVLEHVDDPAQFLSELVRIGKSGAQYLITVPDAAIEQLQVGLAPASYFQKPNHVRIIQRDEFEKLVTDAGLIIESHTYYGFYWSLWWMFFWLCKTDLSNPNDPLLTAWTRTWDELVNHPLADQFREKMNVLLPKSQIIVARKP